MDIPKKKLDRLYAAAAEALSYFQVCNAMDRTNFPVAKGLPPGGPGPGPDIISVAGGAVLTDAPPASVFLSCLC